MTVVTITSDFGNNDHNLASLKGAVFSAIEQCQIVDISNEIKKFDIEEATSILKHSYHYFPEGTIHIVAVNCFYAPRIRILLLKREEQYFIAPDNGTLSLMFDDLKMEDMRYLEYGLTVGDLYLNIADFTNKLSQNINFGEIGMVVTSIIKKISLQPTLSKNVIRGSVVKIDRFGNAITNVDKKLFDKVGEGKAFKLYYSPRGYIDKLSMKYSDVFMGDELCLFNTANQLEIAVNIGNANESLALEVNSSIHIIFEE